MEEQLLRASGGQASWRRKLALDGKCKNGAKNFNTPFVLATHRAHRLLDGHDALMYIRIVEGKYQGRQ